MVILCIVGELAGGGSMAMAVIVGVAVAVALNMAVLDVFLLVVTIRTH